MEGRNDRQATIICKMRGNYRDFAHLKAAQRIYLSEGLNPLFYPDKKLKWHILDLEKPQAKFNVQHTGSGGLLTATIGLVGLQGVSGVLGGHLADQVTVFVLVVRVGVYAGRPLQGIGRRLLLGFFLPGGHQHQSGRSHGGERARVKHRTTGKPI